MNLIEDYKKFVEKTKEGLKNQINDLINNKKNILIGSQFCRVYAEIYDEVIRKVVTEVGSNLDFTIIACGSYGRNELCFKSDIDIVFLIKDKNNENEIEVIKSIIKILWDIGLDISQSIKDFEDCINTYYVDHTSFTALLETRYIAGNPHVYYDFLKKFISFLENEKDFFFTYSIIESISLRHNKYGNSVKLLEPNIKNSAGGLRDLHDLYWIFKTLFPTSFYCLPIFKKNDKKQLLFELKRISNENNLLFFLDVLKEKNLINFMLYNQVIDAYNFLLKTRNELHIHEGMHSDLLKYNVQKSIAVSLGYKGSDGQNVRNFMRDYYLNARKIYRFNTILKEQIIDLLTAKKSRTGRKKVIDDDFIISNNVISFRNEEDDVFLKDVSKIFKVFYYKSKYGLRFDESIRNSIVNSLEYFDENLQKDKIAGEYFIKILKCKKNVVLTLNSMNEIGVLGRFIPEFGKLIAIYQHSKYHYYTVDEHTLVAIKNIENIEEKGGPIKEVLNKIKKREILYLAILFHDIGKIIHFKEHESIGAEIVERVFNRLGYDKYLDIVKFLVKNHLLMEQTAFRRNISDLNTILDFAGKVGNIQRLNYLYLLTYADLSAVNPNVWTEWKAALLNELYQRTKNIFESKGEKISFREITEKELKNKITRIQKILFDEIEKEKINNHFENFVGTSYLQSYSVEEIILHLKAIFEGKKVNVLFSHYENYSDVTIITNDEYQILSKICAVLTANDANIIDAKIFTGKNNLIIDTFKVTNIITSKNLEEEQCMKISEDFESVLLNKLKPELLFEIHKRKWQRKILHRKEVSIKPHIEFDSDNNFTIIDIFSTDAIGFLYKITQTLSDLNLNIYFAKIATYGDGIVDSFYVLDYSGNKVPKENEQSIRDRLLFEINEILNSELISN